MKKIHMITALALSAILICGGVLPVSAERNNDRIYDGFAAKAQPFSDVSGNSFTDGGLTYSLDMSGNLAVTGCTAAGEVTVPAKVSMDGVSRSVVGVGEYAFAGSGVTAVTLPSTVTYILHGAFSYCAALEKITASDNLSYVGSGAFAGTSWYSSLTGEYVMLGGVLVRYCGESDAPCVPDGTVCVSDAFAFSGISSVTMPGSVRYISDGAFFGCRSLGEVIIPRGTVYIGDGAFMDCTALKSVTVPDTLRAVGAGAFMTTPWYAALGGEYSVVGDGVLIKYSGGENACVPEGVKYISDAFAYHTEVVSVSLPDSLTAVGDGAFAFCTSLDSVALPDGTALVGEDAFIGCMSLSRVRFSLALRTVKKGAFTGCTSLRAAVFEGDAPAVPAGLFSDAPADFAVYYDVRSDDFTSGKWAERPSAPVTAAEYMSGDADGSGRVNLRDVLIMKRFGADVLGEVLYRGADTDGNGAVNSVDVLMVKRVLISD